MGFGRRTSRRKRWKYKTNHSMGSNGKGCYCFYCQIKLEETTSLSNKRATRDHVNPKSKGGGKRVWACYTCNQKKGSKDLVTFMNTFWRDK